MGRSIFIAVDQDNLRSVSKDAKSWEKPQLGKEAATYRTVIVGRGRVVATDSYGCNNIFAASTDGKS
jgi:hypothetical protein